MYVKFSQKALSDLDHIKDYITEQDREERATLIVHRILQAVSILENFPLLGRAGRVTDTREFKITGLPYYAVYRFVDEAEISIIAIMHDRRQYP